MTTRKIISWYNEIKMIGLVYIILMNLVNAVTSGSIWNIGCIGIKFHKKAINGSMIEFFSLNTLTVGHRRQPGLSRPSVPAKEGTRDSLNLVVSGHKQLWSHPAANRLPMWLRNNASTGHSKQSRVTLAIFQNYVSLWANFVYARNHFVIWFYFEEYI